MSLITVIGRGHSGTRAISHTLYASGVFMGHTLNRSGDKVPPHKLYDACRVMAKYVTWKGGMAWDFDALHSMDIDPEFEDLINAYLSEDHAKDIDGQCPMIALPSDVARSTSSVWRAPWCSTPTSPTRGLATRAAIPRFHNSAIRRAAV